MNYIERNKAAWEEAFDNRRPGWGDDNCLLLQQHRLPFFDSHVVSALEEIDFTGQTVAQFCCNNGRELLSLMQLGPTRGLGFDIAENLIGQARETAAKAGIDNCSFMATDILQLPADYDGSCDFIFFTIGALTWFQSLDELFAVVARCLRPGGRLMIHDQHPFLEMLPRPGEPQFDPVGLNRILPQAYFRREAWVDTDGMSYMTPTYESKPFTCFSHPFAEILGGLLRNGLTLDSLREFDYDIGITEAYDGQGYPLSYLLFAHLA